MNKLKKLNDLQFIISTVNEALTKEANNAAIFCSLAIPDLCGQIEYPKIKLVNERYSKWYDEYIYKYENIITEEDKINQIDGDVIHLLRCKLFHETSQYHKELKKKIKRKYAQRSGVKAKNVNLKLNLDSETDKIQVTSNSWAPNEVTVSIQMNQVLLARKLVQTAQGFRNEKMKKYRSQQ
ncbi:hypothetical protein BH747_04040 [Enterococcus villorum]|uniref:Uncharacterized protein n=1 Tax=Enterococcus villorum TaxID=112904 RepID=A0A1V8YF37_9ENTE|nr:hypothetical protein [Enterococcus villorum]OQO71168.1 hypothetical protein BH747_04040 [Enterococcus villorum]OQO75002.1 hypothetical protein BH744_06370 [Enterococcus villorum]